MKNYALKLFTLAFLTFSVAAPSFATKGFAESNAARKALVLHENITIGGNRYQTRTVYVRKGETLDVHVKGANGNSEIATYVLDHHGRQMTHDDEGGNSCECQFTASESGTYTIKIVNLDHHPTTVELEKSVG